MCSHVGETAVTIKNIRVEMNILGVDPNMFISTSFLDVLGILKMCVILNHFIGLASQFSIVVVAMYLLHLH